MTPLELKRVLDEHSRQERNKDSFFLMSLALGALVIMGISLLVAWYKRRPRAPVTWEV